MTITDAAVTQSDESLVTITMVVPAAIAVEFQRRSVELVASLLRLQDDAGACVVPLDPQVAATRYRDIWSLPAWGSGEDDAARARWVWNDVAGATRLKRLIRAFAASDGIIGQQLATAGGFQDLHGLRSALKQLATRCRRVQRRPMWTLEDGVYTMSEEARILFLTAARREQRAAVGNDGALHDWRERCICRPAP